MQYQAVGSKVAFRDTRSLVIILARDARRADITKQWSSLKQHGGMLMSVNAEATRGQR